MICLSLLRPFSYYTTPFACNTKRRLDNCVARCQSCRNFPIAIHFANLHMPIASYASRPCGLMDKALVFGTKDCRFESCQGHCVAIRRQTVVPAFGWSFRNRAARARHLACVCRRALPHLQSSGAWLRSSCRSAAQTRASARQLRSKLGSLRAKGTPEFEPGTC